MNYISVGKMLMDLLANTSISIIINKLIFVTCIQKLGLRAA